jgi:hypothetical protein
LLERIVAGELPRTLFRGLDTAEADEKASCGTGISDASLAWRADIKFLAGIIKRRCPAAPYLSDTRRETSRAWTERRRWKALSMASAI